MKEDKSLDLALVLFNLAGWSAFLLMVWLWWKP